MDTIILGNGIIALTLAFRLAKRAKADDRIVVVGERLRPGSASLAAGAMLNSFAEIEAGGLNTEIDLYRFELSHLASRMWPKFEQEIIEAAASCLPYGCTKCQGFSGNGCVDTGTYVINNTAADDLDDENYDAIVAALTEFNEPFHHISPKEIPNYMPSQRHRANRAIYIPNEGWFNPRLMLEKLDIVISKFPQVQFIDQKIDRLVRTSSGFNVEAAVLSDGRKITGDKFVLATGASISDILAKSNLGIDVQRVFYGIGTSIEIQSPDYLHKKCIRTPNRGLACGIYTVPYFVSPDTKNDHILIGASNYISPSPVYSSRISSVESILNSAIEQVNFNFYRANLLRINVGWRPTSQDTYPILGKTSISNLIILSGTKRDGFHLSPVISEKAVAMLYDEPYDERFNIFSPERNLIKTMGREEAIKKAVRHQISASYQHGFTPAKNRMPDQIIKMYRDNLERLHDQVGAIDWGIPPEMLDMYRYGHAIVAQ